MDSQETHDSFNLNEIAIDDYLKCALCGQALSFSHQFDYMSLKVKEEAQCSCCKVKLKSREYSLQ